MLMRSDPFRELDRLTQAAFGAFGGFRPAVMPMDAYRSGDRFLIHFDLPGVDPSSIDLTVEQHVLTVTAQRQWQPGEETQIVASERPQGTFSRQVFLGENLDTDHIDASYDAGVLTITVPVAEGARPRKVEITAGSAATKAIEANAA